MSRQRVTCLQLHMYDVPIDSEIAERARQHPAKVISSDDCLACLHHGHNTASYDLAPAEPADNTIFAVDADGLGMRINHAQALYTSRTSDYFHRLDDEHAPPQ
jgi:hypothetical protein